MRLLPLLFALLAVPVFVQAQDALIGIYRFEGKGETNVYAGAAQIAPYEANVLTITWHFDGTPAASILTAVGFRHKDGFAAIFVLEGRTCLVLYDVNGSKLDGRWTCDGAQGVLFPEAMTKTKATTLEQEWKPSIASVGPRHAV